MIRKIDAILKLTVIYQRVESNKKTVFAFEILFKDFIATFQIWGIEQFIVFVQSHRKLYFISVA